HYCLQVLLKLLAPINPMITEKIYIEIYDKDIHKEEFPEVEIEVKNEIETKDIVELDSLVWKTKKDNGKSLKEEIRLLVIPRKLESIEKDLISAHNVKEIKYGDLRVEL
ncbi:MAG TPA: class I tRNA ligase family protein, partial [Candidatus Nanoarchaeia archaeon]|nr:class I tRNA ligase family protein [Candidatus Nanoarchaeia archaeon]